MKTRKIISTLLAFALVFSLLPTAALAASAHTAHSGSCEHEGWTKLWMDGTVLMAGDTASAGMAILYALGAGMMFGAVYLRTGSILFLCQKTAAGAMHHSNGHIITSFSSYMFAGHAHNYTYGKICTSAKVFNPFIFCFSLFNLF